MAVMLSLFGGDFVERTAAGSEGIFYIRESGENGLLIVRECFLVHRDLLSRDPLSGAAPGKVAGQSVGRWQTPG